MKKNNIPTFLTYTAGVLLAVTTLTSCEDVVDLDVKSGPAQLVVDGWVTNQQTSQTIRLTESAGYFDNNPAKPVLNATVTVTDDKGIVFMFVDVKKNGSYVWQPASSRDTIGRVGRTYTLRIKMGSEEYTAVSKLNRVPKIDSITYFFDKLPIAPSEDAPKEGYNAEFYARDFVGEGDCYWVKTYKNNAYFNKTTNITIAYDAAFSPGANSDGLNFIRPIRRSITPELYKEKDTVKVELLSISLAGYYFLNQVRTESSNQGLFATAPSNIYSNIQNTNPSGRKALGFFGAAGVSTFTEVIDAKKARPKDE